MSERRRNSRQRVFKGGLIYYATAPAINCLVRNVSPLGACLEPDGSVSVPDHFTLLIKPERLKWSCQVEWRSMKRIGVRFLTWQPHSL
jgi:hypothetical protein